MRSKAGRDVQAHNTDSPIKKQGLDSVGNKKPAGSWQQDPVVIFGAQVYGTLFLPPHHHHQSPSFTITYDSYPKIKPRIPSVQLLGQSEASNLTKAINTKPGSQSLTAQGKVGPACNKLAS